jgi:hypothetical protein
MSLGPAALSDNRPPAKSTPYYIFTLLFQFMSLGPAALSDNRPPAKSTPSLSNPNVVFSTPEDVVNKER